MNTGDARTEIMRSIRAHLAASVSYDAQGLRNTEAPIRTFGSKSPSPLAVASVVEEFKRNLEAVDGHCFVVHSQGDIVEAVKRIAKGKGIAVTSATRLKELIEVAEVAPSASRLFQMDVGVTRAQAGIAETGTLVLDSSVEQNRLISLVPPVHIAILDASRIYATLSETLAMLQSGDEVSPAVTFITGPSRTADIELTLTVGVHGPQELYVFIIDNN